VCITDDAYIGGGSYSTALFLQVLLVVFNFLFGTNLPEFGVGGKATEVPEALVIYVEMEMRRYFLGDRAERPAAGGGGRKLTDKGDALREMFEQRREAFQSACTTGLCNLEVNEKVKLAERGDLGQWRKAGTSLNKDILAKLS